MLSISRLTRAHIPHCQWMHRDHAQYVTYLGSSSEITGLWSCMAARMTGVRPLAS